MIVSNRQNNIPPKLYDYYWRKLLRDQITTVNVNKFKVVIITNLEQKQKSENAENTTDLPKTLQVPFLCCFS